jgi:hypothetical protein
VGEYSCVGQVAPDGRTRESQGSLKFIPRVVRASSWHFLSQGVARSRFHNDGTREVVWGGWGASGACCSNPSKH